MAGGRHLVLLISPLAQLSFTSLTLVYPALRSRELSRLATLDANKEHDLSFTGENLKYTSYDSLLFAPKASDTCRQHPTQTPVCRALKGAHTGTPRTRVSLFMAALFPPSGSSI